VPEGRVSIEVEASVPIPFSENAPALRDGGMGDGGTPQQSLILNRAQQE